MSPSQINLFTRKELGLFGTETWFHGSDSMTNGPSLSDPPVFTSFADFHRVLLGKNVTPQSQIEPSLSDPPVFTCFADFHRVLLGKNVTPQPKYN